MTDNEANIAPGDIVAGLEPTELVEIRRVTPFGGRTLIEGIGVSSKREIKRPLSSEDIAYLQKVRGTEFTYDGDGVGRRGAII